MEKRICSGQQNGKAAKARILLLEIIGREAKGKERKRKTARTRIGLHKISFQKKYEVENQRFAPQGRTTTKGHNPELSVLLRQNEHLQQK